jgi:hypothetical protein
MWVVELESDVYIEQGTLVTQLIYFAKLFKTKAAAKAALTRVKNSVQREFKSAKIYTIK